MYAIIDTETSGGKYNEEKIIEIAIIIYDGKNIIDTFTTLIKTNVKVDYFVQKFDKEFIFYEVLFNGTVQSFINKMKSKNYKIDTQKKIWILE